ncbi:MAG: hypothetical protein K1X95_09225 [Acidimicrobiia bacterium]|nr:hypothetical protein [Acidimicrobiia bacterium]
MDDVVIRPASAPAANPPGHGRGGDAPQQWWRNKGTLAAIAGTVLVVVGVVLVLALGSGSGDGDGESAAGGGAAATSPDGSLLDLDTSVSTTSPTGGPAATDPGAAGAAGSGSDAATGGASTPGATGSGGGAAPVLVPRAGNYTFTGSGTEKTTPFLPAPVAQGPTKPATVADAGGGCWRLSIEQNTQHTDESTFCAGGDGSLSIKSIVVYQSNNLGQFGQVKSTLTTICPTPVVVVAPGMAPGAQFPFDCTVRTTASTPVADSAATGTATFVGVENVGVGGTAVPAYHLHQVVTLVPKDGAPTGERVSDVWIATDDGMVLRETRSMTAYARIFGQVSTYTETSEHTLASR